MAEYIVVTGYTKIMYIHALRSYFPERDIKLVCAYRRQPTTDSKVAYLNLFDQTFDMDVPNDIKVFSDLKESVLAVTCTQERDMETYFETLRLCGIASNEQLSNYRDLTDKKIFKERLRESAPKLVPSMLVLKDDTLAAAASLSYPQVVKPTALGGSSFVHIVNSYKELLDFYTEYAALMRNNGSELYQRSISIIAEEYIAGRQYSINAYIDSEGKLTLTPIVRVIPASELGIPDTYSALQYITDEFTNEEMISLQKALAVIVDEFTICQTSIHFDSVLTPDGQWKFFEIGLRIGGNRRKMFELSHGFDHFRNDILNRLDLPVYLPAQTKSVCVVQNGTQQEGILKQYANPRIVTEANQPLISEAKIAKLGEVVKPVSHGGGTITRHFVTGKDSETVLKTAKSLHDEISFTIE